MGTTGGCYANALAESFFATLECELLDRRIFRTHDEARTAVFDVIEGFYTRQRRHSALGYLSGRGVSTKEISHNTHCRLVPLCLPKRGNVTLGLVSSKS
jgi:putative transposase